VLLDDLPRAGQADAGAGDAVGDVGTTAEAFKDARQIRRRDPYTLVA
jgi:hypothetical protein